jgi:hypothetical protein
MLLTICHKNHRGLLLKDHVSIPRETLDMAIMGNEIVFHNKHSIIVNFVGNQLSKVHITNWVMFFNTQFQGGWVS